MSVETDKVCCNCCHCIREWDEGGMCYLHCEINEHYIGYAECFDGFCKHWKKEDETEDDKR